MKNLEGLINYFPDIKEIHGEELTVAKEKLQFARGIRNFVKENPGVMQKDLKKSHKRRR